MHVASTSRGLLADAATLLRLTALASLAFISAAGLALAKDRCADTAQAVQALREDDRVFIMGEDIAEMGGSMAVTQGLLD